jgi:glucokinase
MNDGSRFIGIDVGGTNITTALVHASGQVLKRNKDRTPPGAGRDEVLEAILATVSGLLDKADADVETIEAIGLAVPGLLDFRTHTIDAAPNITISGIDLREPLVDAFGTDVAVANDCDAAALGERWLGAARGADCAIGMFVGTGIGGGIFANGGMIQHRNYSATEIGHMIVQIDGPLCGCGNRGCLEALASRTAIERDLRAAIEADRKTILTKWLDGPKDRIRSNMLYKALEAGDDVVTDVMYRAAHVLGLGCITLRHIFEPDVIILGGGVIEACGSLMMDRIEETLRGDPYFSRRDPTRLVLSALGDDAGVLGAAAMAMMEVGLAPLDRTTLPPMDYPRVDLADDTVTVGEEVYHGDVIVRVNTKSRPRKKSEDAPRLASPAELSVKDLTKAIKHGPEELFIGADCFEEPLPEELTEFLHRRAIGVHIYSTAEAIAAFQQSTARKALLLLTGRSGA